MEVSGNNTPSPQDINAYKREMKESVDLFRGALSEYQKTSETHKQMMLKDVMDKSLHIMSETSNAMVNKNLQQLKDQLAIDYADYTDKPTKEEYERLQKDLDQLDKNLK